MRRLGAAAVVVYAITNVPLHTQANRSELLLARASAYVQEFVARFANVVAEERYVQEISVPRQGNANSDVPARGNLWVEEDTGRIVKSELQVGATGVNAVRITTTFGLDERLQVYVPIEMREFYPDAGNAIATYSRFRRFDVKTEDAIR